jgi:hypothetical protein
MSVLTDLTDEECALLAILDDPSGIELAEFCFLDETPGKADPCFRVRDYQWTWWTTEERYQIDYCSRDVGKALATSTPLPTPTGWKRMGDVRPGDLVYDERGELTRVLAVHPQPDGRPTNRVMFDDGSDLYADDDHLWVTSTKTERRRRQDGVVRTTAEIAATLRVGKEANHSIQAGARLQGVTVDTEIDPYILGYWLGDGASQSGHLTVGPQDVTEVSELVAEAGWSLAPLRPMYYRIAVPGVDKYTWKMQSCSARLRRLGVLNDKNVPAHFQRADVRQRIALLQGLMDSDGHVTPTGRCEITLSNHRLARDVAELLRGLGQKVYWSECRSTLNGRDCGPCWRIGFLPLDIQPFRLRRKADRIRPTVQNSRLSRRYIVGVERVPSMPMVCIEVGAKSHQFLAGEGMIPTHNSQGIQLRAFAFPFNFPGQEMLITAPQLNHLGPIVDKIEKLFMRVRLGREMLPKIKGGGIKHQPQFQASFINGAVIMGRLPGPTGAGAKGQHSHRLEMDEAQDYPQQGWMELVETMKDTPGAQWRAHGVSRGVRDMYYRLTNRLDPDLPFYVHRYMAMHRPGWTAEERKSKIAIYGGSRDNPDYKRNVYGEHGDVTNPVFVLARLMACVRNLESTWAVEYNENVYAKRKLEWEYVEHSGMPITAHLKLPQTHLLEGYKSFWGGMDVGFTNDPSELLIFGQIRVKDKDVMRLLTRIHMMRIPAPDQAAVINEVIQFYGPRLRAISLDKTGNGLPIWQETIRGGRLHQHEAKIKGYGFSEKKAVAYDDRPLEGREKPEDAMIQKNVIEFATDELRGLVDAGMIELPFDQELLTEFQGQVVVYARDESDRTKRSSRYGGGSFHTLDSAKLAILGKSLETIEANMAPRRRRGPVLDQFLGA